MPYPSPADRQSALEAAQGCLLFLSAVLLIVTMVLGVLALILSV